MSARLAVQRALYAALAGDATLLALAEGVYDDVPQDAVPPYVQLGEMTETPWHTFGRKGWQVVATLRTWTQGTAGFAEGAAVQARLTELLDDTDALASTLTTEGFHHVRTRAEISEAQRDPDGVSRQVPSNFRVWVQEL